MRSCFLGGGARSLARLGQRSPSPAPARGSLRWGARTARGRHPRLSSAAGGGGGGFTGDVAELYGQIFERNAPAWHAMASELARRSVLRKGAVVLDVASGPGEPARTIALNYPDVCVVATDLEEYMVEMATRRAFGIENLTADVASIEDLSDFARGHFDAVTCCYGLMFCDRIGEALQESKRVLRPGGYYMATVWTNLELYNVAIEVMQHVTGQGEEGLAWQCSPHSLRAEGALEEMFAAAGFDEIATVEGGYDFSFDDKDLAFRAATLTAAGSIDEHAETHRGAWAAARAFYDAKAKERGWLSDGACNIGPNTYKLVVGRKPN